MLTDVVAIGATVYDFLAALPTIPVVAAAMAVARAAETDVLVAGIAAVSQALDGDMTLAGQIFASSTVAAVAQGLAGNLPVYEQLRDTALAYAAGTDPLVGLRAVLRVG